MKDILIVDDNPENLRLLAEMLEQRGFVVRSLRDGRMVFSAVQSSLPDLILLDIRMPGMDGYEVCQQLKSDEQTQDIPVIFLSALSEVFDKVKAFSVGGIDYITKPFQVEEVLARVKTHVKLRQMQIALETEIAERKRAEEDLRAANASKDTFFSIIAHDLSSPFTGLIGSAEIALVKFDDLSKDELRRCLTQMKSSAESVYTLLQNLLTWSRLQRGVMKCAPADIPLAATVDHIASLFASHAEQKQITLHQSVPDTITVYADPNMVDTVIRNLVTNALKFTEPGGRIEISARQKAQHVEVSVADTGVGIPEEHLPNLFRIDVKVSTTGTAGERGTGLGLPLCRDLVEKNGGTIVVESESGKGTIFRFTLPIGILPPEFSSKLQDIPELQQSTPEEIPWYPSNQAYIPEADPDTLAQSIAALPLEWRAELRRAVDELDIEAVNEIIAYIGQRDEPLAKVLSQLSSQFKFDVVQEIFEKI